MITDCLDASDSAWDHVFPPDHRYGDACLCGAFENWPDDDDDDYWLDGGL